MRIRNFIYLLLMTALFSSCEKKYYNYYEGIGIAQFGPALRFIYMPYYDLNDTLKTYTFFYRDASVKQDTVYFDLYALGGPGDKDRPFVLKQVIVAGKDNAEPGVHYKAFNDPSLASTYVVKAGEVHMFVPVIMLRHGSLREREVVLQFALEENEWFRKGEVNKLWRRLEFADKLNQPSAWTTAASNLYWGKYSKVKHEFMVQQTGERWDQEFMAALSAEQAYAVYWKVKLRTLLAEYNAAHLSNPLKDENGELVVFP